MPESIYGKAHEQDTVWVYLEQEEGSLENVSLEMLAKGRQLAGQMGWKTAGVILGHCVESLVREAFAYGAEEIWLADHPLLEHFTIDAYAHVMSKAILAEKPSILLMGATHNGRDLAGRLAVRLKTGLNADCTGLRIDLKTGVLVCEVSGFGGGVLALIEMQNHRPQMATVRAGVFSPRKPDYSLAETGQIFDIGVDLNENNIRTRIIERVTGSIVDLTKTPVLVAGGRGVDGDFRLMKTLADILGGDVGATRPPVDEGHIERERQVGQTGVVCSPRIAICCGISGAFHFVVGIEKADIVIAINSDPEAPIFEYADYCIVGDVHQIIPALVEALSSEKVVAHV
jgi:electron transfer flavoprotein alpha subunit